MCLQENGRTIVGQCSISHPVRSESAFSLGAFTPNTAEKEDEDYGASTGAARANGAPNLDFSKTSDGEEEPLEARLHRGYYHSKPGFPIIHFRLQVYSI